MWIFKKIDCGLKVVPLVQPEVWIPGVPATRGASFEHRNGHECTDPKFHRHWVGRWRGSASLGFAADGNPDPPAGNGLDEDGGPGSHGRAARGAGPRSTVLPHLHGERGGGRSWLHSGTDITVIALWLVHERAKTAHPCRPDAQTTGPRPDHAPRRPARPLPPTRHPARLPRTAGLTGLRIMPRLSDRLLRRSPKGTRG